MVNWIAFIIPKARNIIQNIDFNNINNTEITGLLELFLPYNRKYKEIESLVWHQSRKLSSSRWSSPCFQPGRDWLGLTRLLPRFWDNCSSHQVLDWACFQLNSTGHDPAEHPHLWVHGVACGLDAIHLPHDGMGRTSTWACSQSDHLQGRAWGKTENSETNKVEELYLTYSAVLFEEMLNLHLC